MYMEGFSPKPLNPPLNDIETPKTVEKIGPATTESYLVVPNGYNSVEILGEEKFNRLQELGASLATSKDLSKKERQEYSTLNREFIAAVEMNTSHNKELETKKVENQDSRENTEMAPADKGKIERLKTLNRNKALLGFLDEDEETERTVLISWYDANVLKELSKIAHTAPKSIEFETPVEIFTENDVSKWKDGTQKFKELKEIIQDKSMRETFEKMFNPVDMNLLKALFLGEKPVVLLETLIDSNNPDNSVIVGLLKSFGIEVVGKYVYDKEQVRDVIAKHENIFEIFGSNDPDEVMGIIGENKLAVSNHLAVGILLGFPIESIKKYSEEEKEGRKFSKRQGVNVYGVNWVDFDASPDSKIKQARLKSAFELSGILNLK